MSMPRQKISGCCDLLQRLGYLSARRFWTLRSGGLENTNEFTNVRLDRESTGHLCRSPAQAQIVLIVTEALHNCARQSFGRRRIPWGQMTAYSIGEPFCNAANGKSCSRQAFQGCLHSNYTERFGPYAWHDQ